MDRRYKHLDSEERGVILAEHRRGASLREIGDLLGRAPSTIGRELRRGSLGGEPSQPYCAQRGGAGYRARRKRCGRRRKLAPGGWLHTWVRGKLIHKRWSPEQIACKLRAMHPEDPTRQISHETRLSRDLRAAAWRVEGRDDRGAAAGKTRARIATHNAVRRLYRPGIIADCRASTTLSLTDNHLGRFLRRPQQDYPAATVAEFCTAVLTRAWTRRLMMTLLAPMMSSRLGDRSPNLAAPEPKVSAAKCAPPQASIATTQGCNWLKKAST